MKKRMVLYAEEGNVLTNGTIYGKQIYLEDALMEYSFYEISEAEYERILEEQRKQAEENN